MRKNLFMFVSIDLMSNFFCLFCFICVYMMYIYTILLLFYFVLFFHMVNVFTENTKTYQLCFCAPWNWTFEIFFYSRWHANFKKNEKQQIDSILTKQQQNQKHELKIMKKNAKKISKKTIKHHISSTFFFFTFWFVRTFVVRDVTVWMHTQIQKIRVYRYKTIIGRR
jgi:hypothetical protein